MRIPSLKQRETRERFRLLVEGVKDYAIFMLDAQGRVISWNPGAERIKGYQANEIIGRDFSVFYTPEDIEGGKPQRVLEIAAAEGHYDESGWQARMDGSCFWASGVVTAIHDDRGRLRGYTIITRDATERKRAEEALRESEERLGRISGAVQESIWEIDLKRKQLWWNEQTRSLFGILPPRDLQSGINSWCERIHPDDVGRVRAHAEEFLGNDDRNWFEEYRFRRPDGSYVHILEQAQKFFDESGASVRIAGAMMDITEIKEAEEARRESEEQARRQLAYVEAIYATAPVGLCVVDADLRILSINERLVEPSGKSIQEFLGRTVRETVPEVADAIEPSLWRVIKTGEPALNLEHSIVMSSQPGVLRHFIASYYPIKNGGVQVMGVNMVVMEITERKKIEEEMERLLREEKAAREEAEAANRMKDEFLATISHELRTPLTSILGWASTLTKWGATAPEARHALEVIQRSAQSQTRLVDDILDTSRIITGRLKLAADPVPIERLFHAAVDVIRPTAEAKGVALSEVVDEPDGVVLGDANRLQQAAWNLLSNAVKFTNKGGSVEARLGRAEDQIKIAVRDTGIGIEPDFLPYVFERFRQADASSTRKYGGLGIGLSIARHIIEMHGGSVEASSHGKGQGATFMIRLPLISAPRLAQPERPRVEARLPTEQKVAEVRLDGLRVLLVEDDPDTLDILKVIFDHSGAAVIAATSVDEALGALERSKPDVLVSDLAMPDRDGYDLISEIRSREPERGCKIPAVAITAYARSEDRMRALAAGYEMYITKPIAPSELIAVVASLTGRIL